MDDQNKYFQSALKNFCWTVACGDAIRHLYDLGYTPEQIVSRLDFPASISQVEKEIDIYIRQLKDSSINGSYEYVRVTDEYGHSSFIRKKKDTSS